MLALVTSLNKPELIQKMTFFQRNVAFDKKPGKCVNLPKPHSYTVRLKINTLTDKSYFMFSL